MIDLLSVAEFADKAGKKKQGIYEQVKNKNSRLYPFVVFKEGKYYIKAIALKEVYGLDNFDSQENQVISQESQANSQENSQGNQANSQEEDKVRSQENQGNSQAESQESQVQNAQEQSIITFLQEQLKEKDKQLAEKDKQIQQISKLLDQEQQLNLRTNLLLAEYQKKEPDQDEVPEDKEILNEEKSKQDKDTDKSKKRSWFYRFLFGD